MTSHSQRGQRAIALAGSVSESLCDSMIDLSVEAVESEFRPRAQKTDAALVAGAGYTRVMSSPDDLLTAALDLPIRERARLARELLRSLDVGDDPVAAEAWTDELRRRLEEVKGAAVELEDWNDVRARLAAHRAQRR
jgi:putative addiction module component (TIGR02574 family)